MNQMTLMKSGLADQLLIDVARQVQLPPSDYRLASQHYDALNRHLNRDGSPLKGLLGRFYAQGGMAIGAVISSRFDTDEFDVDAVVEYMVSPWVKPGAALDTLHAAVSGEPGSRYFGKVTRRTRCVTVDFDRMHVDLTPAVALAGQEPRTSHIFHAHESEPESLHRHITANPWGFADWFERQMPAAHFFADAVLRKAAEPLPEPEELEEQSLPLLALQLVKRWRNKCYDKREGVRRPPSVLLSYFFAINASQGSSILVELMTQTRGLLRVFEEHDRRGAVIEVRNPACDRDVFSDRWPGTLAEQRRFCTDLKALEGELAKLAAGPAFEQCSGILARLFGERPVERVVKAFAERYGDSAFGNGLRQRPGSAAIALGASGLAGAVRPLGNVIAAPRSTNFGSD